MTRQMSKRDFEKKVSSKPDIGHWEGKYWCGCRIRNYRKWLGVKKYGQEDKRDPEGHEESGEEGNEPA
jgi:hypothetical protein